MTDSEAMVIPTLPHDHTDLLERLRGESLHPRIEQVETGAQAVLLGDFTITVPQPGEYVVVNQHKPLAKTFDTYEALLSFLRSNLEE
jgi:hypothetical protein